MATPLGHMLAGATVAMAVNVSSPGRRFAAGAALGVLADADFLPGLLIGEPARFHHAATHSVLAVLVVAMAALVVVRSDRREWVVLAGGAYATHLLLDWLTMDNTPPFGIPLLWPLSSEAFVSAHPLLPRVIHSVESPFNLHNLAVGTRELLVLGPLLLLTTWHARRRADGAHVGRAS